MPIGSSTTQNDVLQIIEQHWGYHRLRPLQSEAIQAVLDGRDSVVVLPTGAGKSLCYQAPAVVLGGTTVVISPLIALMKNQVDSLRASGIPALQLNSTLSASERSIHEQDLVQGNVRLLFVSPERLIQTDLYRVLQKIGVKTFAIDEAHCISHWGHDFRQEFRQLERLRALFPDASFHAYTATATELVRNDISRQLGLKDPLMLVGNFDRPNLTYRVVFRHELRKQIREVLDRHVGEAGIIYCPRRGDVDELALNLQEIGIRALPYHAGMSNEERSRAQEAFLNESIDVMVATVAFGMGIDRSNVRFVLHTAMPKSLEHYQQEAGRAGRDGLEAECVLLYSGGDYVSNKRLLLKSARENNIGEDFLNAILRHLDEIDRYCRGAVCRHRTLVNYFGQLFEKSNCSACDICLGDNQPVSDALTVSQKILSCVARVKNGFGINHIISILRGELTEKIQNWQHQNLSTFGLLSDYSKLDLRDWIYQLIGQGVLVQSEDEYPILLINDQSWEVMRGTSSVRLLQMVRRKKGDRPARSSSDNISWEGVDRELFDQLRIHRRKLASERNIPPYVIFHDNSLREMARSFPSTSSSFHKITGVGEAKLQQYGDTFLQVINDYCAQKGINQDLAVSSIKQANPTTSVITRANPTMASAFALFQKGCSVTDVVANLNRSPSTVFEYLAEYIRFTRPGAITTWVDPKTYARVMEAAQKETSGRLKPIYMALKEEVPYEIIRLVIAHRESREPVQ